MSSSLGWTAAPGPEDDYPIAPVPLTDVRVDGGFWSARLETNRRVTVPYDFRKCEETGRIDNFAKAGRLKEGEFEGIFFNDSDVFKVIEGASYSLAMHPDAKLDEYLDELIATIAAAQEDDGYLYTARTLDPGHPPDGSGKTRWSQLVSSHELYNVGHLYEAAVAHALVTGKRSLLDVALKNAELIDREFGPGKRADAPGHQEIEIGLVKLFRMNGEQRYLNLAKFFLDQRGRANGRRLYGSYSQDHLPVVEQREAVGHAVRAVYMYCAMADVAALTGDPAYLQAIDALWDDVVSKKMYLTGGIGSSRTGEAFGGAYELPNQTAYSETCAAIANALWNHRMFLLHGDAKYIDVLERVIYNGFLAGVSLSGDRFFYPNPLASDGAYPFNHGSATRSPWFDVSCCPVNIVRFVPSIAGYVYARRDEAIFVNLFVGGTGIISRGGNPVTLTQETGYPWRGNVRITVDPEQAAEFEVRVRIPGWAAGKPVPSDLYRYLGHQSERVSLNVNGEDMPLRMERGFAVIHRYWQPGDVIQLDLPMPVRRVLSHEAVEDNRGRVALERGPIVYCLEAIDNHGHVEGLVLPDDAELTADHCEGLLGAVTVIRGTGCATRRDARSGSIQSTPATLTAIPYYAWSHRGAGEMAVWLPREETLADPHPPTSAER